ncbi:EAL domain-containing protein [Vibrio sp. Isolate25]|uniref:putative bifunctional diguanylate cyclase/phosphodiesterase n=1 Tax=Vibrio TaxID=662 RepID=UPI001EFEE212|nr:MULTISPECIES: EAL domain-containing protein [Vibrio]MCG9595681.1 EAL domain-containing protein [Vibrio sp. Isolate25]MCG9682287.1 EAL domain-containing protein [Vibrio sp. Isolate23]USD34176.1 EAL domain-containing protein [Vibrio sp. SCSIO 43186]USD47248.1 EAL domain-containing protein [Vibrio sp. SCSIO 43145]USD71300.1 EAL domain-containing protein [Vibrio sp. SCSIO 43139]
MTTLSIVLVISGIIILLAGYVPANKVCRKTKHLGWQVLSYLILGFVAGYTFVLVAIFYDPIVTPVLFGLCIILFCGSIFVYMVTTYSLQSINQLHVLADEEKHNALHDSLTTLPNRKHCIETIEFLIESDTPFDLMLLDIVNFKQVNDGMGHFCGDQLLIQIGQRISSLLRKEDFIARIGGDEFVLICPNSSESASKVLAKRIDTELRKPFCIDGFELSTGAIIGLSEFPRHGEDAEQIINTADVAMYWAKKSGRLFACYDDKMSQGAKKKLRITREIDAALLNDEFCIYYQPILCGKSAIVSGYEALIRWQKEDGTVMSPVEFIPIAEQSNKITSITSWVLNQVSTDIEKLKSENIRCPVHINLSAKDLMGNNLKRHLEKLIQIYPDITENLILEITESTAINRLRSPEELLESLKILGFKISLDDFGTGYSSLSLLRDLPVDQIKIDRSFLYQLETNQRNSSIVSNAIALAHGLGYTVVAEGVEDNSVLELLRHYGCDYIQGFLYSPALKIDEVIRWTHNHNPPHIIELAEET